MYLLFPQSHETPEGHFFLSVYFSLVMLDLERLLCVYFGGGDPSSHYHCSEMVVCTEALSGF